MTRALGKAYPGDDSFPLIIRWWVSWLSTI